MSKRLVRIVLGAIFAAFLSWPALATDYFIKVGEGAGTCLVGDPCSTIAHANALSLSAGDTVSFNKGDTWNANTDAILTPPDSGSSGSPIIYQAYGSGANPIFSGGEDILGVSGDWSDAGSNRWTRTEADTPRLIVFIASGVRTQGIEESSQANVGLVNEWFHTGTTLTVFSTEIPTDAFDELILGETAHVNQIIDVVTKSWLEFKDLDVRYSGEEQTIRVRTTSTNITFTDVELSHTWDDGYVIDTSSNNIIFSGGHIHDIGTFFSTGNEDNQGIGIDVTGSAHTVTVTDTEFSKISNAAMTMESTAGTVGFTVSNVNVHGVRGSFINAKVGTHIISDSTGDLEGDAGHIMNTGSKFGAGPNIRGIGAAGTLTLNDNVFKNFSKGLLLGGSSSDTLATAISNRNLYMDTLFKSSGRVLGIDGGPSDLTSNADIFFQSQEGEIADASGIVGAGLGGGTNITIINGTVIDLRAAGAVAVQFDLALTNLTLKNLSVTSAAGIALEYVTPSGTLAIDTLHLERDLAAAFAKNTGGTTFSESDITDGTWNAVSGITGTHITGPHLLDSTTFVAGARVANTFMQPGPGSPLIGAGVTGVAPTVDWASIPFRAGARTPNIGARAHRFRTKFPRFGIIMEITPIELEEDMPPEEMVSIWPLALECECETPGAVNDDWPLVLECECNEVER